jgi:hypothetical protein
MRFIASILVSVLCSFLIGVTAVNSGQSPSVVTVEGPVIFSGTYDVFGTNRNGSKYTGTAVVAVSGNRVEMSWLISSGQTYTGKGTIKNGRMVVDFGGRHPVVYEVARDGSLLGKWDKGRASETLIPQ